MKRPLCIASVFYIIGILIGLYINIRIVILMFFCIIIIVSVYILTKTKITIIYFVVLILGFIQITVINNNYEKVYNFVKEPMQKVKAEIISEPEEKEYKVVYQINILEAQNCQEFIYTKWMLNVKKSKNIQYKYGDVIYIIAKFNKTEKARNYKGYDDSIYLKSKGFYGRADATYIENAYIRYNNNWIQNICNNIKRDISSKLCKNLSKETVGIALGILIGDKQKISDETEEYFRKGGLMHLLAVSGMHVSYIIIGISSLFGKAKNRIIKLASILLMVFFMILTGMTPSVMRAVIMAVMEVLAKILHRKSDIYTNLSISTFIILAINPYYILDIGFELSFMATIGIIFLHPKLLKNLKKIFKIKEENKAEKYLIKKSKTSKEKIKECIKSLLINIIECSSISISANILIMPILISNFNTLSLTFWISNILVSPLIGPIIFIGYISYFVSFISEPISKLISIPLNSLINLLILITKEIAKNPLSSVIVKRPYIIETIIYYHFILFCVYRVKIKQKTKQLICILMIIILLSNYTFYFIYNKNLQIYFVDVGQGDCTLICTPQGKNILIDGGGSENSSYDVGKNILFPYLLSRRITKLDYLFISHFDSDHVGGLIYILKELKVKNIIIGKQYEEYENYKKISKIAKEKNIKIKVVEAGKRLKIENNVYFDILWPDTDKMISQNGINNNSLVCKLTYKNFSMLFTGDIEKEAEDAILNKYKNSSELLKADILKVAHHGSKTSTTYKLLTIVNPKYAVIGVGKDNKFGHPSDITIENLNKENIQIYRTDQMGEIVIRTDGRKVKLCSKIS